MLEAVTDLQTPDETLVGRARGGDNSAREELFQRHRGDLYRYAFRLLGHEQDVFSVRRLRRS
jgi:DNA-directed RNA polymerase specialized sigma24 family protein